MLAYKQYADIDEEGTLVLHNLPFRNQQFVEVVVLVNETLQIPENINEKLARLKIRQIKHYCRRANSQAHSQPLKPNAHPKL